MSEQTGSGKLHIDSDWKAEAAREKQRLAEQEKQQQRPRGEAQTGAGFIELLNMLAMQAVIGLGGYQGPGGERIPPNPAAAKHHIDLLEVLDKKTAGNLNDEEKRALDSVLYELRMQYVQFVSASRAPAPKAP